MLTSCNSFKTSIALTAYNLDDKGIIPLLLTQKQRYSVSVRPENDVSAFTLNYSSASLCRNLSNVFIMYSISCLVINSTLSTYAHTM